MSSSDQFTNPRSLPDILPKDHEYQTYIKKVIRHRCRQAGFRRVTTPMFEQEALFKKAYGEDSEMMSQTYRFEDMDGKRFALKPESTAGAVRAYVQHMQEWPKPVELFYIDPHFRQEPELGKGQYNHFWQFGYEIIGEHDAALDAQLIQMSQIVFEDLGIAKGIKLEINMLGDAEAKEKYNEALKDFFFGKERYLTDQMKNDLEVNPMRLLNSKNEDLMILSELAPTIDLFLSDEEKQYFAEVQEYLDEIGIEYTVNPKLVRNFDFYNGVVFEFSEDKKNGIDVGGGGHYDSLVEEMGGEPTPALGFAAGMERITALMKREKVKPPSKDNLHVFVAQLSKEAKKKCLGLIRDLRDHGIKTMGAMGKGAIRHQLSIAEQFKVPYTLILGLTEVRDGTIIIRDMAVGTQEIVPFEEAIPRLIEKLGEGTLDKYSPGEILY